MEQVFSTEYFITFGVLLACYCVVRFALWWEFRMEGRPVSRADFDGHLPVLDAASLSKRLEQVRQSQVTKPQGTSPFKKSLLVETRREELSHHSYFHKPPLPPETPEDEHGSAMLLV